MRALAVARERERRAVRATQNEPGITCCSDRGARRRSSATSPSWCPKDDARARDASISRPRCACRARYKRPRLVGIAPDRPAGAEINPRAVNPPAQVSPPRSWARTSACSVAALQAPRTSVGIPQKRVAKAPQVHGAASKKTHKSPTATEGVARCTSRAMFFAIPCDRAQQNQQLSAGFHLRVRCTALVFCPSFLSGRPSEIDMRHHTSNRSLIRRLSPSGLFRGLRARPT
jgi:hypothetical protein